MQIILTMGLWCGTLAEYFTHQWVGILCTFIAKQLNFMFLCYSNVIKIVNQEIKKKLVCLWQWIHCPGPSLPVCPCLYFVCLESIDLFFDQLCKLLVTTLAIFYMSFIGVCYLAKKNVTPLLSFSCQICWMFLKFRSANSA